MRPVVVDWEREWRERCEKRSAETAGLVEDGRSRQLWKHRDHPTPEQHTQDLLRWAFWRLSERSLKADKEATDKERLRDVIETCISWAREDEQKRSGEKMARAAKRIFGEDTEDVMYAVAERWICSRNEC